MTLLDRYILKQFLLNFVILFFVLFLFTCIIDLFVNVDAFILAANAVAEAQEEEASRLTILTSAAWIIVDFYAPRAFQFYAFFLGIVTVGATGFTLVQFHRHRELTAVLAAGISLHRVAMPIVMASIVLNAFQFINRELIIPPLAPLLLREHGQFGESQMRTYRISMLPDGFGRLFYARNYVPSDEQLEDIVVLRFDDQLRLRERIEAESAVWIESEAEFPTNSDDDHSNAVISTRGHWQFTAGEVITISETGATRTGPDPIEQLTTDLDPTRLILYRHRQYRQMLSLQQINELQASSILEHDRIQELTRIRYGRFAMILNNILTLLVSLPFFLLRAPTSLLNMCIFSAAISLFAQIGGAVGTVLGLPGVPPIASVFVFPLLILLPLSVALMSRVET